MIKVLHVITRLPIGGAERMLIGALRKIDRSCCEPLICCLMDRGELADEAEAYGIRVISLGLMHKHGYDRNVVPALCRLIKEQEIDLVHTHLYHANLYGRLAAHRCRLPSIASVHNTYTRRKWYRHLVNRFLARHTFRITAGSPEVLSDILSYDRLPPEKVVLLPNGIDLSRVDTGCSREEARRRLGIDAAATLIGTVGRMEEQKGQRYLLEAFAKLLLDRPQQPLRLLIVGDGRLRDTLTQYARDLGIYERCHFPGSISQLAEVYRAIDIFTMPSLWEGLSLAMLEAMAAGLSVVATDVGGAKGVLGESEFGLLVPPGDSKALSTALACLVDDTAYRHHLGSMGRQHVSTRFSVDSLAKAWAGLYQEATLSCK